MRQESDDKEKSKQCFLKINLLLENAIYDTAQSSIFIFPTSCYLPRPYTYLSILPPATKPSSSFQTVF